jgi:membrane-bound lytic murein transglycosylase D
MLLAGCMSSKPQMFKLSFLPATPLPVEPTLLEPPVINAALFAKESPNLVEITVTQPVRPPEVDSRIVRAQDHFETGKKLYQQGDAARAREEFDRAIDVLLSAPANLPDRQRLERQLDQMAETIYRYDLEGLGAGVQRQEVVYDKSPLDSILEMTFPTDPNLRPKVKEEIAATSSQLPLEENDAVLSYIHYFSSERGHKALVAGLRRAGRFRPLIQRILDEEGVPQELIYLAQVESGFLPRARSNKKAVGMWQFVQFRGREYGLNQTASTDDRMDPELATHAAARHLHDLYALFGDWYLAMSAYNCGPGCVDRAVQRTGYADFWELRRLHVLPRETENYVPLILAVTIMAKNPKDYELENLDVDPPVEYDTIALDAPTSLALIADATERPLSDIQELNPCLLKPLAAAGYPLRVPKGSSEMVLMALEAVPLVHRVNWRVHRVAPDETLADIARRFSTPAASISAVNQRAADHPEAGDMLVIPASYPAARAAVHPASTQRKIAHRGAAPKKAPVHKAAAAPYKTASLAAKHPASAN